MNDSAETDSVALVQVEMRAELDQGAPAEFAEAAVRSVFARLTEAPTNLHPSTPGILSFSPTPHESLYEIF
jgi:hypothetical protein